MKYNFLHMTLLYVEDDNIIRENALVYLQKLFLHVFEAKDGLEGLAIYKETKPDIIIADIKMPKLDGLELAKKIRKNDLKTPIIITTAYKDNDILMRAVDLHLSKYIVKPITPNKLHKALEVAYEQHYHDIPDIINLTSQISYDIRNKQVLISDEIIKLTKHELLLLDLLVKYHQRVITYKEIELHIWPDGVMSIDSVRSLIRSLRKKLTDTKIENISGIGYRLHL